MIGGIFALRRHDRRRRRHGLDVLHALSAVFSNTHVVLTIVGIFINGFSSILTGLNFIVTIHKMRAPGMTWFRLPLFFWAIYATSMIMVLGTPVLAITLLLVAVERIFGVGIFDPALGGDPILFQHMFWFYSHPAVYIMVLPGMGVISEIDHLLLPASASSATTSSPSSSLAIAVIGFLVWGHHMFVAGISRSTQGWSFRCSASWSRFRRRSRSSTGPRRCTKARSTSRRRCSMRSASSGCSPSAG